MDPNECLREFDVAVDCNQSQEALMFAATLLNWLAAGGFEPNWSKETRMVFYSNLADMINDNLPEHMRSDAR